MAPKIQGIILDVDGVIVGEKIGFNSPDPNPLVMVALRKARKAGIKISLCTAKPHYSIGKIISGAQLDNLHITDGGGVIIDPLDGKIQRKYTIAGETGAALLSEFRKNKVYCEIYSVDGYYAEKSEADATTKIHTHILQREPILVESLEETARKVEITKLMIVANDAEDKKRLETLFAPFASKLTLSWGIHPIALPRLWGIITAPGISKMNAAIEISKASGIPLENYLGIGDSESDWQFIELCGYGAAMGNASDKLKGLVRSKGPEKSFVGPGVDENGIITILDHFLFAKA